MTTGTMMIMRTMRTMMTINKSDGVMRRHDMTLKEQSKRLVTCNLTLETLITLTGTAFAILAMF